MDLYRIRSELMSGKSIYDLPLRVTFYARVSTGTDEQANSLKNQISYYRDFINQNPNWTYIDGYTDEALSGTNVSKREAFLKMIVDAKQGKFDFIITKEISRFSRNTLDSIRYTQELLAAGAGVLFQSDNINTLMPDAELRLTIMSSIAQDEVRKISERVKFGFKRAIENGVVLGNSKIWGYTKSGGKLVIDENEAEMIREIFSMYATQNMGIRKICDKLNERGLKNGNGNSFSFSTIKGILTNPKYMGYYCGNKTHKYDYKLSNRKYLDEDEWVLYKDADNVPPIVSEEIWRKANEVLKARSLKQSSEDRTSYQNKYKYSGKIICARHNAPYYRAAYRYKSGDKEVWQCREYSARGKAGCTSPAIYTSELDQIMKDAYEALIKEKTKIIDDLTDIYSSIGRNSKIKEDIIKANAAIKDTVKKKDKLLDLSVNGHISDEEFGARNRKLNGDIKDLEYKIKLLEDEGRKSNEISASAETLRKLIADELEFEDGFDNAVIDTLLDRVEVLEPAEKKVIRLNVYFKAVNEQINYKITRGKTASVCSEQHI